MYSVPLLEGLLSEVPLYILVLKSQNYQQWTLGGGGGGGGGGGEGARPCNLYIFWFLPEVKSRDKTENESVTTGVYTTRITMKT